MIMQRNISLMLQSPMMKVKMMKIQWKMKMIINLKMIQIQMKLQILKIKLLKKPN
jgi:hypothetical protein